MTDQDPYQNIADLYMSLVSSESYHSTDLNDPVVSEWISKNLANGAKILDAGCGLGYETIALHKGLLGKSVDKRFSVYASDSSEAMLAAAIVNGVSAGLDRSRYRKATFAELANIQPEWQDFDAIIVNHGIYTFPDNISINEYNSYFQACCRAFAAILKTGGYLIFNLRDWSCEAASKRSQVYENEHDGITYKCKFSWTFNPNGHHTAVLDMSNTAGKTGTTHLNYAQRTPDECISLATEYGFVPIFKEVRATIETPFHVVVLQKHS